MNMEKYFVQGACITVAAVVTYGLIRVYVVPSVGTIPVLGPVIAAGAR